jgi:hypothetical protein
VDGIHREGAAVPESPITVRCQFDSFDEPVSGSVTDDHGRRLPFRGWVELAAALAVVAEGARPTTPSLELPHDPH